jgi:hypothetical protein
VQTTTPITRSHNSIRFKVTKLGNWVGVGIADTKLQITGGNTLGNQDKSSSCAYFWQSGINQIQMLGEPPIKGVKEIYAGDVIDIKVDFDANQICFLNNEQLVGTMSPTKVKLQEDVYLTGFFGEDDDSEDIILLLI